MSADRDYKQVKIRIHHTDTETLEHIESLTSRGMLSQTVSRLLYNERHKNDAVIGRRRSQSDDCAVALTPNQADTIRLA